MKLENQVVSLYLSKRLKKLGVKSKSYFRWETYQDPRTNRYKKHIVQDGGHTFGEIYPAYTVAELGDMIPMYINGRYVHIPEKGARNIYDSKPPEKKDIVWSFQPVGQDYIQQSDTEADARAETLIYLLDKGIISLSQINND